MCKKSHPEIETLFDLSNKLKVTIVAYVWSLEPEARSETVVLMTVLEVHVVQDRAELE